MKNNTTKGGGTMIMVYLLFIFSIFFIHIFAGYDSRFQKVKYFTVKSSILRAILLDSTSFFSKTKRLKKDQNKMSACGLCLYIAAAVVLMINLVFLIVPDIPITPWGFETTKFIVSTNTLNDKISAIAIFLLLLSIMECFAVSILRTTDKSFPKWIKVLIWSISILMLLVSISASIYFLFELICCFL